MGTTPRGYAYTDDLNSPNNPALMDQQLAESIDADVETIDQALVALTALVDGHRIRNLGGTTNDALRVSVFTANVTLNASGEFTVNVSPTFSGVSFAVCHAIANTPVYSSVVNASPATLTLRVWRGTAIVTGALQVAILVIGPKA